MQGREALGSSAALKGKCTLQEVNEEEGVWKSPPVSESPPVFHWQVDCPLVIFRVNGLIDWPFTYFFGSFFLSSLNQEDSYFGHSLLSMQSTSDNSIPRTALQLWWCSPDGSRTVPETSGWEGWVQIKKKRGCNCLRHLPCGVLRILPG